MKNAQIEELEKYRDNNVKSTLEIKQDINNQFAESIRNSIGCLSLKETVSFLTFIGFDINEEKLIDIFLKNKEFHMEDYRICANTDAAIMRSSKEIDQNGAFIIKTELLFTGDQLVNLVTNLLDSNHPMRYIRSKNGELYNRTHRTQNPSCPTKA